MSDHDDHCVMCARFPTTGYPQLHVDGRSHCQGFERTVAWDDHRCVLFNRAKNIRIREAFAEQQKSRASVEGNACIASTTETNSRASAQPQHNNDTWRTR